MALSETAKLLASLEFKDKLTPGVSKALGSIDRLEAGTNTLGRIGGQVGRGLQSTAQNLGRIGLVGAGLLAAAVTNGIHELEKLENATAQTNAVLESTQGVAGQTAESVRNLAEKYEGLNATIDDKVIQSGENVLLTFTNVTKDAFEPALEAALNLNTALGGGEEGLQGTIIQVGKALSDPIKGLTSLRRVGVVFTKDQEKQIRALVESNDLYGAQKVILAELSKEFGGSFSAAGDTAAGKFAKVRDAVEDAQAALATAFLPVLEKVADKLGTFLSDPATVKRIQDFGGQLAGGFDKLLEVGGSLPWKEIGDAFKIVGTGSKALLDAFLGLPSWVQTAVLTGWGLNKLTGGALGGIAGTITKALVSGGFGGRGSTPLNPLFVSQVGGVGGPTPIGGPAKIPFTPIPIAPVVAAIVAGEIAGQSNVNVDTQVLMLRDALLKNGGDVKAALEQTGATLGAVNTILEHPELQTGLTGPVLTELDALDGSVGDLKTATERGTDGLASEFKRSRATGEQLLTLQNSESAKRSSAASEQLQQLRETKAAMLIVAGKDFSPIVSPTVNVRLTTNTQISVSNVVRTLNSYTAAVGSGPGGAVSNPY